ncbi:MAG: c-type cytochrome domain-containing protein [Pirellulaceae bacterium]
MLGSLQTSAFSLAVACLTCTLSIADETPSKEQTEKKITFEEHIKPIFREHCTACHSESDKSSDLALDTYGNTLAGGSSGDVVADGDASGSRIFALMTHAEQPYMPPDQDPIAKEQIALVKTWIEQGMPENAGSKIKRSNAAASAMLGSVSLGKPDGPPPMPESMLRQPVRETERSAAISAMAASPWAPLLAVGGQEQVSLYHCESGELLGIVPFPEGEPQSLVFTRDGKQLLIGGGRHGHSGCAVLVDVATGERIAKVGDELDAVLAADISPNKKHIAIAGPQKIVRVYETLTGELAHEMKKHTDWIFALRYSPDGVLLASGDRSNGLILWEADTGTMYADLAGHKGAVRSVDFRSDSNVLASGSMDGTIKLWDLFESKQIKSWNAHGGGVTSVAYTNTGILASAGRDRKVKTWDGNGAVQKEFKGLSDAALEVAATGDASFIGGGDWNGQVSVWSASTPDKPRLVAANPASIDKRLAMALAELDALKQQHSAASSKSQKTGEALASANATLETRQARQVSLEDALGQKQNVYAELRSKSQQLAGEIRQLEEQLESKRAAQKANNEQLGKVTPLIASLETELSAHQSQLGASKSEQQRLASEAQSAHEEFEAATQLLKSAEAKVAKAKSDQAALQARQQSLASTLQTAEAETLNVQQRLEANKSAEIKATGKAENLQQQLSELREKMDALSAQLTTIEKLNAESTAQLDKTKADSAALQQDFEAAQSKVIKAQEELELFQKSYRRPE